MRAQATAFALIVVLELLDHCEALAESTEPFGAATIAHARQDAIPRRLVTPHIGPITASLVAVTVADIRVGCATRAAELLPHRERSNERCGQHQKSGEQSLPEIEKFPNTDVSAVYHHIAAVRLTSSAVER
jgi:hypothetical protein